MRKANETQKPWSFLRFKLVLVCRSVSSRCSIAPLRFLLSLCRNASNGCCTIALSRCALKRACRCFCSFESSSSNGKQKQQRAVAGLLQSAGEGVADVRRRGHREGGENARLKRRAQAVANRCKWASWTWATQRRSPSSKQTSRRAAPTRGRSWSTRSGRSTPARKVCLRSSAR